VTSPWLSPWLLISTWLLTTGLVGIVVRELGRRRLLGHPNDRSSHVLPVPRGAGWGVVPVVLLTWWLVGDITDQMAELWPVLLAGAALAAISSADDVAPVDPRLRLLAHLLAVVAGLCTLPDGALLFQGLLPLPLDRAVAGLAWLWFVNLYNFMDGIDGITGAETLSLGVGLWLVATLAGGPLADAGYAAVLAGAALGLLVWNWHRAQVFPGDVGSIPLGFLAGWLLLRAAAAGLWLPALLLPAYYLTDATVTLVRRLLRGEPVWQAHRQHFYQQAAARLQRHDRVALAILAANAALIALAVAATLASPWWAALAPVPVALLLAWMAGALPARP
jgi:UDP-N-acetylmuramyl pentapeptide phosphotransferase/UDP-N-acetylglucosamine-1-phosphate transferase